MKCLSPISAFLYSFNGKNKVLFSKISNINYIFVSDLLLPCNKCYFCRSRRAYNTFLKLKAHYFSNKKNCYFITLTYSYKYKHLSKSFLQKFFKRLRNHGFTFSYFALAEYGDLNLRPHYHVIFFNIVIPDLVPVKFSKSYSSILINKIWGAGFVDIQDLSDNSISYVSAHNTKRKYVNGLIPEFTLFSKSLCRDFYNLNINSVISNNSVVVSNKSVPIFGYFLNKLKRDPNLYNIYKNNFPNFNIPEFVDKDFLLISRSEKIISNNIKLIKKIKSKVLL